VHSSPFPGAGFRGTFRDLSLWIDPPGSASIHSDAGNDLWVVEYNDAGQMATERRRAEKSEVSLILEEKFSLVLQGDVPGVMGYDACGSEANMTVISVPDHDIVERPMPVATASKRLTEAADPAIEELLQQMSEDDIVATITQLQSYNSRNSASGGANLDAAADWAAGELTRYGGWTVTRDNYRSDYTPQIIAEMVGAVDPNKVVVMGAHLDSTASRSSSSISARAPGADDNGSGSASVMAFAKAVASTNTRFRHTIRLCLFTGEEQGLRGSRDLARRWRSDGVNIIGMINTDMIGYRQSGAPITVNFMNRYVSSSMTNIAKAATGTYLPGVGIGDTAVCCSDQQSFHENGFPAVSFFETTPSSVVYPQYHTSSDLLQNFDSAVVVVQGKAAWATLAVMAEIDDGSTPQPTPAPPTPTPPTPPSPTPPSPTPPAPSPSPTPPSTGGCVHQKDCAVSPWCNATGWDAWCQQQGNAGSCPSPYCTRA